MKSFLLSHRSPFARLVVLPVFFLAVAVCGLALVSMIAIYNGAIAAGIPMAPIALGANTIDNLIPDTYAALKVVSRELVGLIPAVNRDSRADRLAIGQSLRSVTAPVNTAGKDITAAMALPAAADQTLGNVPFTLSKVRAFPFSWSGEQAYAVQQGPGLLTINQQQIAQAIRAAVGEISTDLYAAMRKGASRAYGTAGTTPFATDTAASAQLKKILDDNGTGQADRHLVLNTTAGANMRSLASLQKVNEAGSADMLRQGTLLDINGFAIREDAKIISVTKGTAASATTNAAGYAVGATTLTLAAAGTGTILAGDVITFAGDTNKYVVKTGNADVSAAGTIVLAEPGLLIAMSAATKAITVGADFTANLGFTRDFAILGTRLPFMDPSIKDLAYFRETIIDPVSLLAFELAAYPGYRMAAFEIGIAWGQAVENPEHGAILLG